VQEESPTEKSHVLVADDNVFLARTLGTVLERWNFAVSVVHDGWSALTAAKQFRPAALLIDLRLPGLDGLQVARQVRSDPQLSSSLLLALTGAARDEDRTLSLAAGFDHHLVKPIDIDRLRTLLERRRAP
jgi:CheY-like chemotaxis protein